MRIYMIRHGQSTANEDGTHSGWSCVPLTEKGRQQALAARKNLEGIAFDKLFVSDVLRAQQTADILFPDVPRTFIPVAREMNNTAMKGKTREEMIELFGDRYLACRERFDYHPLGIDCESFAHLRNRAKQLLDMALQMKDAENIAVVSHAGFIVAMACCVLGLSEYTRGLACHNVSMNVFEYKNDRWRIEKWNIAPEI